ncbi:hypothetical protein P9112_011130 [Eukaryota sp. TZLM1-RC]
MGADYDYDSDSTVPESPEPGPLPDLLPEDSIVPHKPSGKKRPFLTFNDSVFLFDADGSTTVRKLNDYEDFEDDLIFSHKPSSEDLDLIKFIQELNYTQPSSVSLPDPQPLLPDEPRVPSPLIPAQPPPKPLPSSPADSDLSIVYEGASPTSSPFSPARPMSKLSPLSIQMLDPNYTSPTQTSPLGSPDRVAFPRRQVIGIKDRKPVINDKQNFVDFKKKSVSSKSTASFNCKANRLANGWAVNKPSKASESISSSSILQNLRKQRKK